MELILCNVFSIPARLSLLNLLILKYNLNLAKQPYGRINNQFRSQIGPPVDAQYLRQFQLNFLLWCLLKGFINVGKTSSNWFKSSKKHVKFMMFLFF